VSATTPYRYDPAAFRQVFEHHFTYLAGFRRNTHRYGARPALHDPASGRRWTYTELGEAVDRVAAGLVELGVGPGDVVVHQLPNVPEFALLYLATQQLGAIGAPLNFRLSHGETAYVLDDSRPTAYVYDASLSETAGKALALAGHRPRAVVHVGADTEAPAGARDFGDLLASTGPVPSGPPTATVYDETTRLYTSGTTGMPKGVSLNSLVEVLSAHDVAMHFPLTPEDRTLNMTPWFHRGGLHSGGPCPVFYVGAEAVSLRQFDADVVLDLVERLGLTFLIGAPTNLALLTDAQQRRPRDLSSLRGIVTMGSPLDRQACLRYQEQLTPRIFNGYGTTEAFWNTFLRPADLPEHSGSAGRACTDDDVAVVRLVADGTDGAGGADGAPTPVAKDGTEVGEVAVRSVKSGYAYVNRPQEQSGRFRDGWLYIGDLATWDADEYVTIVGRKDDMIISGGENVHPVQVEAVLNEHPDVVDSVVVGLPDPQWGEVVVAYVVTRDGSLDPAALDDHCRNHPMLARYKRPRAYCLLDQVPVTATGKKRHFRVREQVVADAQAGRLHRV
jgi:acyl-CoA synthetase (AMP-forming)/AMP-acid ligase II